MTSGEGNKQSWRAQREAELAEMGDDALKSAFRLEQDSAWRESSFLEHVKAHRRQFERLYGYTPAPAYLRELTADLLASPDRVYTGYDRGQVTWMFIRTFENSAAVLVGTRGGLVRTIFPALDFSSWVARNPRYVEVTGRLADAP